MLELLVGKLTEFVGERRFWCLHHLYLSGIR